MLVAGFISGGTDDVDANLETVRLLRSQLRTKSGLRVIEADVLPLVELAADKAKANPTAPAATTPAPSESSSESSGDLPKVAAEVQTGAPRLQHQRQRRLPPAAAAPVAEPKIRNAKDLEKYQSIFSDVAFWKKIGEEYQNPLIVTGTVLFTPLQTSGFVQREREAVRQPRPPPRRAAAHLHGAQGLHPRAEVHLHRRPHRRDAPLGERRAKRFSTTRSRTRRRCRRISS